VVLPRGRATSHKGIRRFGRGLRVDSASISARKRPLREWGETLGLLSSESWMDEGHDVGMEMIHVNSSRVREWCSMALDADRIGRSKRFQRRREASAMGGRERAPARPQSEYADFDMQ
jgi:hypothetical protein